MSRFVRAEALPQCAGIQVLGLGFRLQAYYLRKDQAQSADAARLNLLTKHLHADREKGMSSQRFGAKFGAQEKFQGAWV